jgi:CotH kinase protein
MKYTRSPVAILLWIAVGLVLLSLAVFAFLLGPSRATRIAGASVLSTALDGFSEDHTVHRIPVLDLQVDPAALDSLQCDLPWSGGDNVNAQLLENGIAHKVKFRYRGAFSPSHFLGGKKSFRLSMKRSNPWSPYRKVNVINPKALNLVNDHMAAWVAGSMGVPVPMNEMVFVRLNGEDHGVMELYEQVDGDFERNRHLISKEVPVLKGDYPPIIGRELPKGRSLWLDAKHWEDASDASMDGARGKLNELITALVPDTMPISAHRDSIAARIDVETWLRYEAALLVLNTVHIDQYHNQWLVLNPRTDRFYPVLWDALLMFAPEGEPLYYVNDAMTWWTFRVPEWRLERDRSAYQAMVRLHREGAFTTRLDEVIERIQPSVLADRNKHGNVTLLPEDVHRVSLLHVISSLNGLRTSTSSYWERMLKRMEANDVQVRRDSMVRIASKSEVPLRLSWTGPEQIVTVDGAAAQVEPYAGGFSIVLHRSLKPPAGGKDHPLVDRQHLVVQPLDAVIGFSAGIPATLVITNAITDAAIQ